MPEPIDRCVRELREEVLNARECGDATVEVSTTALETMLAAFEQLTAKTARPKPAHKAKREYRFPGDAMTGPHDEPQP